jgi:hypothetical protein
MKEINIGLKIEEVNLILNALGNLPYLQVHELFAKIQSQATQQLNAQQNGNDKHIAERNMILQSQ